MWVVFEGMSLDEITEDVDAETGLAGARGLSPGALQHGEGKPERPQPVSGFGTNQVVENQCC